MVYVSSNARRKDEIQLNREASQGEKHGIEKKAVWMDVLQVVLYFAGKNRF